MTTGCCSTWMSGATCPRPSGRSDAHVDAAGTRQRRLGGLDADLVGEVQRPGGAGKRLRDLHRYRQAEPGPEPVSHVAQLNADHAESLESLTAAPYSPRP